MIEDRIGTVVLNKLLPFVGTRRPNDDRAGMLRPLDAAVPTPPEAP
jgi:hypothetical protein